MHDNESTKQDVEAYLDAAIEIKVPLPFHVKGILQKLLVRIGLKRQRFLTYKLRKIKVGNRERMAIRTAKLPKRIYNDSSIINRVLELSRDHTSDLVYCAAVALQNDENEPEEVLLNALKWVDDEFLFDVLTKSVSQIDYKNFLNSIVLLTGIQSLTMKETQ